MAGVFAINAYTDQQTRSLLKEPYVMTYLHIILLPFPDHATHLEFGRGAGVALLK
jgi:hypothetical protein